MNTVGQRVAYVVHALGKTGVAERLGVSERTLRRIQSDDHGPSLDVLAALSALGWSASWILTGEGDAKLQSDGGPSEPQYDWLAFRRQFLVFLGMSPDKAAVIRVSGDSMYPDLQDGDTVLVDLTDRRLPPKGARRRVYVVHLNDGGLVVKFAHTVDDQVHLVSASPEYPEIVINPVECTVVGRVRWFARTLLDGTL